MNVELKLEIEDVLRAAREYEDARAAVPRAEDALRATAEYAALERAIVDANAAEERLRAIVAGAAPLSARMAPPAPSAPAAAPAAKAPPAETADDVAPRVLEALQALGGGGSVGVHPDEMCDVLGIPPEDVEGRKTVRDAAWRAYRHGIVAKVGRGRFALEKPARKRAAAAGAK